MSDETEPTQLPTTEDEVTSPLDHVTNLALDSTIPAPILKRALKAFGQLCTAAIEWPAAYFEGKTAEKRAETQARIKIIEENAAQIAGQVNVPREFARLAGIKFSEKIIREQINLDNFSAIAANEVRKEQSGGSTDSTRHSGEENIINDDWLNTFEEEARQKSTEDMQLLFGRILAGEINKPGSYSIKAVKTLTQLDQRIAILFKRLCSVSSGLIDSSSGNIRFYRVISLQNNPMSLHTLEKYGLSASVLDSLQEYGLTLDSNLTFWHFKKSTCLLRHQGRNWTVSSRSKDTDDNQELNLYGAQLTRAACELIILVEQEPVPEYTKDLKNFLAQQNFQMIETHKQSKP